ncbi:hypothetical protein PsorP6_013990 [Peronosclerospora sorghi]|uniref:Uncharacterized protein n=1 Tax=Peronosclerospora sorghi TaxID=230839 RepID=A0ACC0VH80_9STRA|nr:hypothetical protein PsorP6_013990 [Peronosclerospora sorghi]
MAFVACLARRGVSRSNLATPLRAFTFQTAAWSLQLQQQRFPCAPFLSTNATVGSVRTKVSDRTLRRKKLRKLKSEKGHKVPMLKDTLRKLYMRTHPDLFGRYPEQQRTNEASYKELLGILDSIEKNNEFPPAKTLMLPFFLKTSVEGKFKEVNLKLRTTGGACNTLMEEALGRFFGECNLPEVFQWKKGSWGKGVGKKAVENTNMGFDKEEEDREKAHKEAEEEEQIPIQRFVCTRTRSVMASESLSLAASADAITRAHASSSHAWQRDVQCLALILVASTVLLGATVYSLVVLALTDAEWAALQFPTSLEAAQALGETLQRFAERRQGALLLVHMACYLYLQTFAIPGTVFFNLLGGALFGVTLGFPLCLAYNTLGSVFMFLLSRHFGRRVVTRFFPRKLAMLRTSLEAHRDEMALYMIFLRVFPFTPNWFVNLASPHLAIPLSQFTLGPLVGLMPYNFLSCKAGLILRELRSRQDIIDTVTTVQLILVAVVGGLGLPRMKKHFATRSATKQE